MKQIKWIAVAALFASSLSGCGLWDRHPGTQSSPVPDQAYWTDRTWRQDISRQWREDAERLRRMRESEFFK